MAVEKSKRQVDRDMVDMGGTLPQQRVVAMAVDLPGSAEDMHTTFPKTKKTKKKTKNLKKNLKRKRMVVKDSKRQVDRDGVDVGGTHQQQRLVAMAVDVPGSAAVRRGHGYHFS